MTVHSLDLARAKRELLAAVGPEEAAEILAGVGEIVAEAEHDPGLRTSLLRAIEADGSERGAVVDDYAQK